MPFDRYGGLNLNSYFDIILFQKRLTNSARHDIIIG